METDAVVIGAGVIGLAVANKLADSGLSVVLLEKEEKYGMGISSRSTETIHAGMYYQTGSLKALLCRSGRDLLYNFCEDNKVRVKKIGKLLIARRPEELSRLEATRKQALSNGVTDIVELDRRQLRKLEPLLDGIAALLSPSSGIFDSHGFMKALFSIAKSKGVIFAGGAPVVGAERSSSGWEVRVGGRQASSIKARLVVNAAGLYAIQLSKKVFPGRKTAELYPSKGCYIRFSGPSPVSHIVYSSITPGVIEERVDATPDLNGSLRFGPNTEEVRDLDDFNVRANIVDEMAATIKSYLPSIDVTRLHPDCAGIRPRIYGPNERVEDFRFEWAPEPGWLDLWGMESPALTASLAISNYVKGLIEEKGLI
ncbi:MAG: NAD(P)/FAD-dependent oxidoreductase [Candidatus Omnitrophica bacterium]|nr:NAD(P)/FAD-dependent oxidoreductase [Candidatus Omnitrophota bacterium]